MKVFCPVVLFLGLILAGGAARCQAKLFYYYPAQNVYFNVNSKQYLFEKDGRWCQDKALPQLVRVNKKERVCIISGDTNVLSDSLLHKQFARTWAIRQKRGTDTTQYLLRVDRERS